MSSDGAHGRAGRPDAAAGRAALPAHGARLDGVDPRGTAVVIDASPIGDGFATLTYRVDGAAGIQQSVLTRAQLAAARPRPARASSNFRGDPRDFTLAAEALRIRNAGIYDPLAAVHTSAVEPLPHQLRAVYEELLPRVPLRFLLADDPGSGKTIMAGLYIKELRLRGALDRCLIVAPGALVEQWQEELAQKFGLTRFEILDRAMVERSAGGDPFRAHPFLIARMDQLARNDALHDRLRRASWDLAVIDEAHRMSAHYSSWRGEVKPTLRFKLGRTISATAHNLLLMTATPHSGNEEDFQLFMSLLDPDRFEGRFRPGAHRSDTRGLMRRLVKEDLLTFDGKPLFPQRRATTIAYTLSPAEMALYNQVTDYVRQGMNLAERISAEGDRRRGSSIGFALTMLQRRLASSPEAICRSLERRRERLRGRLAEARQRAARGAAGGRDAPGAALGETADEPPARPRGPRPAALPLPSPALPDLEDFDDTENDVTDSERAAYERQVDDVVDQATAARTVDELRTEIADLDRLVAAARAVRDSGEDRKWNELARVLASSILSGSVDHRLHKLIVFTEHVDTLSYLTGRIRNLLGSDDAVVTIHGGMRRAERREVQARFAQDPRVRILVATDAAGEGLNLQRANLMVNYDLPWNPNRIEQRFGRIHRIGQRETCFLWNLVAKDTREGQVFERLLTKLDAERHAYSGNLFDVLGQGDAFDNRSLRDLLIQAIRYGDDPRVRERLERTVDAGVSRGLAEEARREALDADVRERVDVGAIRRRMEAAEERRLQPGFVERFFLEAFARLGGRVARREAHRYALTRVPPAVRERARGADPGAPVPVRYERVTFHTESVRRAGAPDAELIAPGHALLDAVIALTLDQCGQALREGTVLVDNTDRQGQAPSLLYAVEQRTVDGCEPPNQVDSSFAFVTLAQGRAPQVAQVAPYLDFDPPTPAQAGGIAPVAGAAWVRAPHEGEVVRWSIAQAMRERLPAVRADIREDVERTRAQVRDRLVKEANYWDNEARERADRERAGKPTRPPRAASERAERLRARLAERERRLDMREALRPQPPDIRAAALVIPGRLLPEATDDPQTAARNRLAKDTGPVERRSVDLVLATERRLGRVPVEMEHSHKGFDIRSRTPAGDLLFLEVKGCFEGSDEFCIRTNEAAFSQNQIGRYVFAMVRVSAAGPRHDEVRYLRDPFADRVLYGGDIRTFCHWGEYWDRAQEPS